MRSAGFEKLTTDLRPAIRCCRGRTGIWRRPTNTWTSTCLPRRAIDRLVESFPEDSLADDAALESARRIGDSGESLSSTRCTARRRSHRTTR